jgi:hypothetical protein
MSTKSLLFTIADITVSPRDVQESLNHACLRGPTYYSLAAVCQVGERVLFLLDETRLDRPIRYRLVPMAGETMDEVRGEVESHYQGQMLMRGIIQLEDSYAAVYQTSIEED